ncbi:MAG: GTPase [Thermoprotei archaeon]|nr:MAG: GTPase [Thermoprotei archaeon]
MRGARRKRVIIMGAGGRDFHNFNVYFRNREDYEVVAFTASQIPNIDNRTYPPELAGPLYPNGIPIYPESLLEELIKKFGVEEVVLSYSDLLCGDMLTKLSRVLAAGAHFRILSVKDTMLRSRKPVVAVTAVRTGAGKSSTARRVVRLLKERGVRPVVIRHPMAYGDLVKMRVQKFSSIEDLDSLAYTIEEKEEYEWHVLEGTTVYAGVDYEAVLREVEEGPYDVIVWDGGNNDWPFIKPDLYITVVDPTRPGHEVSSFPGLVNLMMADVVLVNKANMVSREVVEEVIKRVRGVNPRARIIVAASEVTVDRPEEIRGRRVLVVEDGPSVTHGHMSYGAGYVAAQKYGAAEVVDPRPYAVGSLREVYAKYRHIGAVLPAMGYGAEQMRELEETINRVPADVVVLGTPTDLSRYLRINKPVVKVRYEVRELEGSLAAVIDEFLARIESGGGLRRAVH